MQLSKFIAGLSVVSVLFISQALTPDDHDHDKDAMNLKVLPKNISDEELHAIMKQYAKSLGVKCNHCHAQQKENPEKLDFSSDEKPEKALARKMMKMTADINKKYIAKIDEKVKITCFTCHSGHEKPENAVDTTTVK